MKKLPKINTSKLLKAALPYILVGLMATKLGQAYRLAEGIDLSQKLLHFADGCAAAFESAAPSFHLFDLLIGVAGALVLRAAGDDPAADDRRPGWLDACEHEDALGDRLQAM